MRTITAKDGVEIYVRRATNSRRRNSPMVSFVADVLAHRANHCALALARNVMNASMLNPSYVLFFPFSGSRVLLVGS